MGFLPDVFGANKSGMRFRAKEADVEKGYDKSQIDTAYNQTQSGLGQQQDFANALRAQNGMGNQASVFNQQQALANQLQNVANGTGPNPALAQLNQTTGQNVQNQAALMAGQRGAGSNVGLMARQIGQQGAGLQQQAVGQGATLAAQQQLAGMNALQNQQNMMGSMANQQVGQYGSALGAYNSSAQNQQRALLDALAQYNNAQVNTRSNVNNANAAISAITAKSQNDMFGGFLSGLSGQQAMGGGGGGGGGMSSLGGMGGGGGGGGGGGMDLGSAGTMFAAHGGMVPKHYDVGGTVGPAETFLSNPGAASMPSPDMSEPVAPAPDMGAPAPQAPNSPMSFAGQFLKGMMGKNAAAGTNDLAPVAPTDQNSMGAPMDIKPMENPNQLKEESIPISQDQGTKLRQGAKDQGTTIRQMAMMGMSKGAMVPGKAPVKGDSLKNDTVPAMLSPGEVVIPRHVMQSDDPVKNTAAFVAAILKKQNLKRVKK